MAIEDVSVSDARTRLSDLITLATEQKSVVYLTRHGKRVAGIVDADTLTLVLGLAEDMEDSLAAEEAIREMKESDERPIPWEQVAADLGVATA